MLTFKTGADDTNLGEMVCRWDENAALIQIRSFIETAYRAAMDSYNFTELPTEAEIQRQLDRWTVKALRLLEKYAPKVFFITQDRLVYDVTMKLIQEAVEGIEIRLESGRAFTIGEISALRPLKDRRKELSEYFKTLHNEAICCRCGVENSAE